MNKPYAWEIKTSDNKPFLSYEPSGIIEAESIPLYTHPAELTDEEIADFLYAYCLDMGDVYEASEAKLIECIRAILRKAQEK